MNIRKATRKDANILRRRLLKIEAEIKKTVIMAGHRRSPLAEANADISKIIAGIDDDFISHPSLTELQQERLGSFFERARVLNEMFLATPAEIERFEKVMRSCTIRRKSSIPMPERYTEKRSSATIGNLRTTWCSKANCTIRTTGENLDCGWKKRNITVRISTARSIFSISTSPITENTTGAGGKASILRTGRT